MSGILTLSKILQKNLFVKYSIMYIEDVELFEMF